MKEVFFDPNELIVSKTDLTGRITYANALFCEVCGYRFKELMGQQHSIVRHADMPRAVFKLLWDRLALRHEVFAFVKNRTKQNDFYWVFAHITPSINSKGEVVGYHSARRAPDHDLIRTHVEPLYRQLIEEERSQTNRKQGLIRSSALLERVVADNAVSYDDFVFKIKGAA
ncbi:PAS domain S-box-containing protein [Cohaesibacter sp. ES.047]|uniref:PAS domain-containing protein n=1 Tax=Cohaesibacter sp. ES.047 TaxID=1798205 RepID=UPI000BB6828B|nr:PAS domain-containing protein [Cohaesibacter sp. ES.047]SNY93886.1 PAS domain S-box-containing protein [Cohaesibacter sp. ES.047]